MKILSLVAAITSIIIYLWPVSFSVFAIHGEEAKRLEIHPVMLTFSKAIKGLEKGLDTRDVESILTHTQALKNAGKQMADLEPQKNRDLVQLFNEYRTQIASLSSEALSLSKAKDLAAVSQVVAEIRSACICCHVRFRDGNDERGLFPARHNMITGQVKILEKDGKTRSDRSDVLVFLDRVQSESEFPLPRHMPVISQENRRFTPRVLPVMKGTTVIFPNDDTIFHNVFSLSKCKPFDLDIYPPGESRAVTFNQTGWVKVYCNIHPDMISHIIVLNNPFFALTDEKGIFVIPEVPKGEYTLRTWHELGKEVRKKIQVSGRSFEKYSLEIQEDKNLVQHKNKFGRTFKGKY